MAVVGLDDALVADRDPVAVTPEVVDDLFGTPGTGLRVDNPLGLHQVFEESVDFPFSRDAMQLAFVRRLSQRSDKRTAKPARKGTDRKQIVARRRMPSSFRAKCAARHQAMQVHVARERFSPRVQHGAHAHLSVKTLRIGAEGVKRHPRTTEQRPVDDLGMESYPAVQGARQREHDMMVGHRQDIGSLSFTPRERLLPLALRTMAITTTMVVRLSVIALITAPP